MAKESKGEMGSDDGAEVAIGGWSSIGKGGGGKNGWAWYRMRKIRIPESAAKRKAFTRKQSHDN